MKYLIDKLRSNRRLDAEEYKALLLCRDTELAAYLQELAREEALARFGNKIFIRGLIEITNRCRNNCYYCGIRKENRNIVRYELAQEEILSCCHEGYWLGFRTFVLQGGEAQAVKDEGVVVGDRCVERHRDPVVPGDDFQRTPEIGFLHIHSKAFLMIIGYSLKAARRVKYPWKV